MYSSHLILGTSQNMFLNFCVFEKKSDFDKPTSEGYKEGSKRLQMSKYTWQQVNYTHIYYIINNLLYPNHSKKKLKYSQILI